MRYIFVPFFLFVAVIGVFAVVMSHSAYPVGYNNYGTGYGSGYGGSSVVILHSHSTTYSPSIIRRSTIRSTSVTRRSSTIRRIGR